MTLLLGPGIGQFYNRRFKKGLIILGIGLILIIISFIKLSNELVPLLPQPLTLPIAPETIRSISLEIMEKNKNFFVIIKILFAALWSYALVDAYYGAKKYKT